MIVVDRYTALGIPHPDPETMCKGDCEGTGLVPVYMKEFDQRQYEPMMAQFMTIMSDYVPTLELRELWEAVHREQGEHKCDGWHFVVCPTCHGTRERSK